MKNKKGIFALALASCLSLSFLVLAGCGGNKNKNVGGDENDITDKANLERRLTLSTSDPDGVFNPFFSTSMVDSNMIAMTQLGMLSTDKDGNIVCGQDEPTVVEDYSIREVKEGNTDYTYYQFIIKNGVKFSDGKDLTIKDVLFNLYVYLDPAYTGSSTIYSTDIVGLNEYRTQNPNATPGFAATFESERQMEARERITNLSAYTYFVGTAPGANKEDPGLTDEQIKQVKADFTAVGTAYRSELDSDWNAVSASMDSYIKDNKFTATWQVFLNNSGTVDLYKLKDGSLDAHEKDEKGNYFYDPDSQAAKDCIKDLNEYLAEKNITATSGTEYDAAVKAWAIDYVYNAYFGETIEMTNSDNLDIILNYSATASTILTDWTAEQMTKYFSSSDGKQVPNISGIKAKKGGAFSADKTHSAKNSYSNSYDMLEIKIKGIDPKAIYNFAFTVAPMHYYSADGYVDEKGVKHDCIKDFDGNKNFGVVMGDSKFFKEVLNDATKGGIPVGAGVYRATNASGETDLSKITRTGARGFFNNNIVYFRRNNYFTTVGTGIDNAKILFVNYQVVASNQIVSSLATGSVDFGEPSATDANMKQLNSDGISHVEVKTNGYGYVGINARFVPNITVRRAIMKAMNRNSIVNEYYAGTTSEGENLAEIIERPMSTANWAYPEDATVYTSQSNGAEDSFAQVSYGFDSTGNEIRDMLKSLEKQDYYLNSDGVYTNGADTLDYTFTIAGGSNDHPAYNMFIDAMNLLNGLNAGIHVKVETSSQALSDLTTGKLQIWAAAWTSTIDPDLYQVYHKDSRAASTLNWGYDYIKRDGETYSYEQGIVNELSTFIDAGRKTNDQAQRKLIYSQALDKIMELAVELPTYQRKDMFAFRSNVIDVNTMQHNESGKPKSLTPYNGPLARLWEVDYTAEYKASYEK